VQQSIDISCPPGPQQQTRRSGVQRPDDEMDGHTDRLTDARHFRRPCTAYIANRVDNSNRPWKSVCATVASVGLRLYSGTAAAAAAALLPSLRRLTVCSIASIARLRASCLGDRSHRLPIEYHLRHNGKSVSSTSSSEKSRETLRINVLNRFAAERSSVGITMQCLQHNRWAFIKTMHNNKGSTTDVINVRRIFNVL